MTDMSFRCNKTKPRVTGLAEVSPALGLFLSLAISSAPIHATLPSLPIRHAEARLLLQAVR